MSNNLFGIEAYGVQIGINCNDPDLSRQIIEGIREILPNGFSEFEPLAEDCAFTIDVKGNSLKFFIENELDGDTTSFHTFLPYFLSRVRLRIAERAVSKVFIHAGAIVWNGKGVIFPANSFRGKTTIVKELLKHGAEYLSDEYAILDENGMIQAFPKTLSVRGIEGEMIQTEIPVETFGGKIAKGVYPVGVVIFTEFEEGAVWRPDKISPGNAMLEIISHTIPIRYNANFSLQVLKLVLNRAILLKSKRGDSEDFAKTVVDFFENHLN